MAFLDSSRPASQHEGVRQAIEAIGCMHQGMIITDDAGVIGDTNLATEKILETPSLNLKGMQIREFCAFAPNYEDSLRVARAEGRSLNKPVILQTSTGKRKLVNMSIQSVGELPARVFVHVFQDCADMRTMEERLLQSERLATVGRFASQIAHEIRNPLSSISLNMELLEDELDTVSDEARSLIRSVMRELDRLNDIVGEYLQFSRFPKPNLKLGKIDGVIADFIGSFKLPDTVKLETRLAPTTPEIWLDERLLRNVFENLVKNAVEAISGSGTIRIETDVFDRFLAIRVIDTGQGIPPDVLPKLFEPFFTTKTHGTGLGLATAQQIVFEHNGHLLVDSEPGKGATFTLLLPT